jgi:hypothetical protein
MPAMYETDVLNPILEDDALSLSTEEEGPVDPGVDVFELISEILGYDIREVQLMAEGYREAAGECLWLAENNIVASAETLPPLE